MLNLSGELRSAERGDSPPPRRERAAPRGEGAVPTARGKRVDTYGFYPLNSRFPLFLSPAKIGERRLLRNEGNGRGFFLP